MERVQRREFRQAKRGLLDIVLFMVLVVQPKGRGHILNHDGFGPRHFLTSTRRMSAFRPLATTGDGKTSSAMLVDNFQAIK